MPSDERNRARLNGFLTVDLHSGATRVQLRPEGKTSDVVFVLALTVLLFVQRGYRSITVILDNARTHRQAMEVAVKELLSAVAALNLWEDLKATTVEFLHTPPYSLALNPAEYLIHWIRQDALYHLPCTFTLQDNVDRIRCHLAQGPPLISEQIT